MTNIGRRSALIIETAKTRLGVRRPPRSPVVKDGAERPASAALTWPCPDCTQSTGDDDPPRTGEAITNIDAVSRTGRVH